MPISSYSIDVGACNWIVTSFAFWRVVGKVTLFAIWRAIDVHIGATEISITLETSEMIDMPNAVQCLHLERKDSIKRAK